MRPTLFQDTQKTILWTGIEANVGPAIYESWLYHHKATISLLFVSDYKTAIQWANDVYFFNKTFHADEPVVIRLLNKTTDTDFVLPQPYHNQDDKIAILNQLHYRDKTPAKDKSRLIVITTPDGFFQLTPPRNAFAHGQIHLHIGQTLLLSRLVEQLAIDLNYDSEAVCESPGQFAVRGGLVDVFPLGAESPSRIDFFGDEIEAIRIFDPVTQLSSDSIDNLLINAVPQNTQNWAEDKLMDYLPEKVYWAFFEPEQLAQQYPHRFTRPEGTSTLAAHFQTLLKRRADNDDHFIGLADIALETDSTCLFENGLQKKCSSESLKDSHYSFLQKDIVFGSEYNQTQQETTHYLLNQLLSKQKNGFAVIIVTHNEAEQQRLHEIITQDNILKALQPNYLQGTLAEGFCLSLEQASNQDDAPLLDWPLIKDNKGVVIITDDELFGRRSIRPLSRSRHSSHKKINHVDQLLDFSMLAEGDYLVHIQHGICIYRGLTKIKRNQRTEEVISLEFDERIILHLPLTESHLLSRYVGLSKTTPKLGLVGSNRWGKTRCSAEQGALDFAAELLQIQAKRQTYKRPNCQPDIHWQTEFENAFIHNETNDQLSAINAIKKDLEKDTPMDRLLCGDVGFGKTEVAIRAAFKAVMNNKQVCVLAPTTVLVQQHCNTFRNRMAAYPIVIESLSRFRSPKEQKQILQQLKQGAIDIIIGTHRLLSRDVCYHNLGLLIIDEEHRFGVRQKETLKRLRNTVDILSMSATPIPRSLYFALVGARDLSVIETAPVNRLPIETFVKPYDLTLIKKAIQAEVDRGGQVFYLHNRVQTIESVTAKLNQALPKVRIAFGHGQMDEGVLEQLMAQFVAGEYDVLVCTTIIESGLDIPNCNTLIVESADRFGLSQLYQLRGRVGRSGRQAYAYLLLHRHAALLNSVRKRLAALQRHNQLGAGFKIAMRDLEIRGAGNLLGQQQSGFIAGVGFELYCNLLRQSISRLKGEPTAAYIRTSLRLDFVNIGETLSIEKEEQLPQEQYTRDVTCFDDNTMTEKAEIIEACIPVDYLKETLLRIDFYRQLALADTSTTVDTIAKTLKDRFGTFPQTVKILITVTQLRCLAEAKRILVVETEGNWLKLLRASGKKDDYVKIGNRFPRLQSPKPLKKLQEIDTFLKRLTV